MFAGLMSRWTIPWLPAAAGAIEAIAELPGLGVGGVDAEGLQGHRAADDRVESPVHHTHRAPAEFAEDAVPSDGADNGGLSRFG